MTLEGGAVGGGEKAVTIGRVVVKIGEVVVVAEWWIGFEDRGGDGAIGASGCGPPSPAASRSTISLEAAADAEALGRGLIGGLLGSPRAFLAWRLAFFD